MDGAELVGGMSNALFEAKSRVVVLAKSRVKSRTIRVPLPSVTMASGPSTDADKIQFPDLVIGGSRRRFYVGAADPIYKFWNGSSYTQIDYLEKDYCEGISFWYDATNVSQNYPYMPSGPHVEIANIGYLTGPYHITVNVGSGWAFTWFDGINTYTHPYSLICRKDYYAYKDPASAGPPLYYYEMFDVARIYGPARGLVFQYSGLAYRNGGGPDSAREIVIPHGAYYVLQATGDSIPLIPYPVGQYNFPARAQFIPEKTFADYPQYFSASKDATDINIDSRPI